MVVETSGIPSSFNWASIQAPDYGLVPGKALSSADKDLVKQLKALDKQVRTHEEEHLEAGGNLARGFGASYQYTAGPDGRLYATHGAVEVDSYPVKDPQGAVDKAERTRKMALAPGLDASMEDQQVAAQAQRTANAAAAQEDQVNTARATLDQMRMAYAINPNSVRAVVNKSV